MRLHRKGDRSDAHRTYSECGFNEAKSSSRSARKDKALLGVAVSKEIFRRTGRVHRVEQQIVDRENARYYKHVEDAESGQIIKHQREPLSQHIPDHQKRKGSEEQQKGRAR